MKKKRVLFTVQGEGHGHMTQAIKAAYILRKNGYEVVTVILGNNYNTLIPKHFQDEINCPIHTIRSLELHEAKDHEHSHIFSSIISNFGRAHLLYKSLRLIHKTIRKIKPDLILNFYEPLMGVYHIFHKCPPTISLGHQFLFLHPKFPVSNNRPISTWFLNLATHIVGIGSKKKLALSFYPLENDLKSNTFVIPPLIKTGFLKTNTTNNNNHLTIYLNRPGFLQEIKDWQKKHNDLTCYCFTNLPGVTDLKEIQPNFFLHPLSQEKFVDKIATGLGLVTTAGFESVCEAAYMGKPVLMFPMHIEQEINGADAHYFGIGQVQNEPNVDAFFEFIKDEKKIEEKSKAFRDWEAQLEEKFIKAIESL